jgi:PrtD family type I secretion system ABC transporter
VSFLLLALLNEMVTRNPLAVVQEQQSRAQGDAEAIMRNAEVVNALGMGGNAVARWLGSYRSVISSGQVASDRARSIMAFAKWWRMTVQVAVMGLGAFFVLRQEMAPGSMIASSILLGRALAPIEGAIDTWKQATAARRAYVRLRAFFAEVGGGLTVDRTRLPAPQGLVSVRNLVFGYPGLKAPTIQNVSFDAAPGEVLAIVGPSGAGKSTLARLLTGIYPPRNGTVRLDGADISRWDRGEVGPHLGYLPQDVELFAGTIAENIARLGPARDEDVVDAARLAGAHEMILALPNGYDTESGEAGSQLSGGQRQRIGLARALFGNPPLIILDEPNANLDDEGEAALHRAIAAVKARGGTVLMIAHRPSMLEQADRILVLRDGRVQAIGERAEILKQITRPKPVAVPVGGGTKQPPRVANG